VTPAAATVGSPAEPVAESRRTPASTATLPSPAPALDDEQPFWMPTVEEPRPRLYRDWPTPRLRAGGPRPTDSADGGPARPPRPAKPHRRPALGLFALIVLALLATFFAWVSAEPLWLAVGHGDRGTAQATRCSEGEVEYDCIAFTAASGAYTIENVDLLGIKRGRLAAGSSVTAQMVSPHSSRAYAADRIGLNLRWAIGLALVVFCGAGIAWATGATRLDNRQSRRQAVLICLGAPLLLALGFLAATW
jgi:hypothetical protein